MRRLLKITLFCLMLGLFIKPGITQTWNDVGFKGGLNPVICLAPINGDLYVGGHFSKYVEPTTPGNWVARFDGLYWDSLNGGADGQVNAIVRYNGFPTIAGWFSRLEGTSWNQTGFNCANLGYWDGNNWSCINPGGGAETFAMTVYNNKLYIAGNLTLVGNNQSVNRIAAWNGSVWDNVGGGVTLGFGLVRCMAVYNGELYVGGDFYKAGNVNVNMIAKWNGTVWSDVSGGLNDVPWSMCVDTANNVLYVGGNFTTAGGQPAKYVARWDGNSWAPVGNPITSGALAMTIFQSELYVGAASNTGQVTDTIIAKWDGNQWTRIAGPDGQVRALAVYNGNLYAGGYFNRMNSDTITCLACYGNTCPQGVGIKEQQKKFSFKVYPNPSSNEITIQTEQKEKLYVKLYNSSGGKVFETVFHQNLCINVSKFASGIYQIQVCNKDGNIRHSEKVVLK